MKRLGIETQDELGARAGDVSKAAVNQWFSVGKISPKSVRELSLLFGRPQDEIWDVLHGVNSRPRAATNVDADWDEVRGFAQAVGLGHGAEADEYAEVHKLKFRHGSLQKKRINPSKASVFYGKGDSMMKRIKPGDAVLFDESDTRIVDEKIYIVMWRGEYNAKRAEVLDDIVYFKADNPEGDHNWRKPKRMDDQRNPITVIGRVKWIGSWED